MIQVTDWLTENSYRLTFEKDGHTWIGKRDPELAATPYHRTSPDSEIAVVAVCLATLSNGIAQARVNAMTQWKARNPEHRWVVAWMPRGIANSDLVLLKGIDQVVFWPRVEVYPQHSGGPRRPFDRRGLVEPVHTQ